MRIILLIYIVLATTVVSHLILKKGMMELSGAFALLVKAAFIYPYVLIILALQTINFLSWVLVLSRANLGYASSGSNKIFVRIRDGYDY